MTNDPWFLSGFSCQIWDVQLRYPLCLAKRRLAAVKLHLGSHLEAIVTHAIPCHAMGYTISSWSMLVYGFLGLAHSAAMLQFLSLNLHNICKDSEKHRIYKWHHKWYKWIEMTHIAGTSKECTSAFVEFFFSLSCEGRALRGAEQRQPGHLSLLDVPSGKRTKSYGKSPCYENGNIHYFDWAIFQLAFCVSLPGWVSKEILKQNHHVYHFSSENHGKSTINDHFQWKNTIFNGTIYYFYDHFPSLFVQKSSIFPMSGWCHPRPCDRLATARARPGRWLPGAQGWWQTFFLWPRPQIFRTFWYRH